MMLRCSECGKTKPEEAFPRQTQKARRNGRSYYCRPCKSARRLADLEWSEDQVADFADFIEASFVQTGDPRDMILLSDHVWAPYGSWAAMMHLPLQSRQAVHRYAERYLGSSTKYRNRVVWRGWRQLA